jgi:hypothetical protein
MWRKSQATWTNVHAHNAHAWDGMGWDMDRDTRKNGEESAAENSSSLPGILLVLVLVL